MNFSHVISAKEIKVLAKIASEIKVNLTNRTVQEEELEKIFSGEDPTLATYFYSRSLSDRIWVAVYDCDNYKEMFEIINVTLDRFPNKIIYTDPATIACKLVDFYIGMCVSNCIAQFPTDRLDCVINATIDELKNQVAERAIVQILNRSNVKVVPSSHAT